MGEKIRDLSTLSIGETEFVVELNHGYTIHNKYSIHIQNEKMRLALNDKEFLKLCGMILRADSELDFLKKTVERDSQ